GGLFVIDLGLEAFELALGDHALGDEHSREAGGLLRSHEFALLALARSDLFIRRQAMVQYQAGDDGVLIVLLGGLSHRFNVPPPGGRPPHGVTRAANPTIWVRDWVAAMEM